MIENPVRSIPIFQRQSKINNSSSSPDDEHFPDVVSGEEKLDRCESRGRGFRCGDC